MTVEYVITEDMVQSQQSNARKEKINLDEPFDGNGMVAYRGWNFCLMLHLPCITHGLIAHEMFHLTHKILNYVGEGFSAKRTHEGHAYLCQYLTKEFYADLRKWRIKVKK